MANEPEPTTEPEAPAAEPEHDGSLGERMTRLENLVERFVTGHASQAEPEQPDIRGEVRAAVREVQKADRDKAAKDEEARSIQDEIKDLKAKVEKPPEEFRKVTQAMGWNRP